jgi:hypothetical protein
LANTIATGSSHLKKLLTRKSKEKRWRRLMRTNDEGGRRIDLKLPASTSVYKLDLTKEERLLMRMGLLMWLGPISMTDPIAECVGFEGARAFKAALTRLMDGVPDEASDAGMTFGDWDSALKSVEIAFGSVALGGATEWKIVTGLQDDYSFGLLRSIQRKYLRLRRRVMTDEAS